MGTSEDEIHLYKYLCLIEDYLNKKFSADKFDDFYWKIRRYDEYLMKGHFSNDVATLLSQLDGVMDSYCTPDIADYNKSNPLHDIDANELYEQVNILHKQLLDAIKT